MDGELPALKLAKDDRMPVLDPVSFDRGRVSQPETFAPTAFTRRQLDAVAPLNTKSVLSLRENNSTDSARRMLQRRIEEARKLKYPGGDDG